MRYELKGNILQYCNEKEEEEEEALANLLENIIFDSEDIYTHYKTEEKSLLKYHKDKKNSPAKSS